MPATTDYAHALSRLRQRATELGSNAQRELPFAWVALRDLVREFEDPAAAREILAEVDAAYRQVMAEIVPQQRAREEVTP